MGPLAHLQIFTNMFTYSAICLRTVSNSLQELSTTAFAFLLNGSVYLYDLNIEFFKFRILIVDKRSLRGLICSFHFKGHFLKA